uniref:Bm1527 n=1 Tax=Brugia malayi TaxID=6279 RepID=A0A1I9GE85_BRUMA|nr:Bm1527 [Brugia malayi]
MMHRDNVTWWSDSPGSFGELSQGAEIYRECLSITRITDATQQALVEKDGRSTSSSSKLK